MGEVWVGVFSWGYGGLAHVLECLSTKDCCFDSRIGGNLLCLGVELMKVVKEDYGGYLRVVEGIVGACWLVVWYGYTVVYRSI